jgi:Kef-type K+ transport system membrane component KefB
MIVFSNVFSEIAALLAIATLVGSLAVWLRQPLIVAFIAVGILIGPAGLGLMSHTSSEEVELFAELGIALLLFVVGLKLDLHEIRSVGPVALVTAFGKIFIIGGLGYLIALILGLSSVAAFYIGISLTFSSTIIVVKLLSDNKEIDALHSRIAVGVLIVEDIMVVLVMIGLTVFSQNAQTESFQGVVLTVLFKGSTFLLLVALGTRYLLPRILARLAQSTELLVLFAITWAIALAALSDLLGFSQEIGAFLAGVALATTPYRSILGARLVNLRDFLLLFFFINLGLHVDVTHFSSQFVPGLIFCGFVLVVKPLLVMTLVGTMGYRKYTCALTSFYLSQISEFSLILGYLGIELGHISGEVMGLMTFIGLVTMGVSSYMILNAHALYQVFAPWLGIFERPIPYREKRLNGFSQTNLEDIDIIVLGLGRYGGSLLQNLHHYQLNVFGVDFDPELVKLWRQRGMLAYYGDAEDPEFVATLPINQAHWVVSTIPNEHLGLMLLHTLQDHQFKGQVALTSHTLREKGILEGAGADLVLFPFRDASEEAARRLAGSARQIEEN